MTNGTGLYDKDDYYTGDGQASRLASGLNSILYVLDWAKARSTVRAFKQLCPQLAASGERRVLDIGAGDGKFLFFMRRLGFKPSGTTASATSQQAAREVFDVPLEYTTQIPEAFRSLKFDVISYWHVFEHLEDPPSHASVWPEILTPGGVIVIEVPNIDSIGARLCFDAWLGSDVAHHVNHMTSAQFDELFAKYSLKVVRREGYSLKFIYPFLWSALLGATFGTKKYNFDTIFNVLKDPIGRLRSTPLTALNMLASVVYLAPAVGVCALIGMATGRGEVLRFYVQSVPK